MGGRTAGSTKSGGASSVSADGDVAVSNSWGSGSCGHHALCCISKRNLCELKSLLKVLNSQSKYFELKTRGATTPT